MAKTQIHHKAMKQAKRRDGMTTPSSTFEVKPDAPRSPKDHGTQLPKIVVKGKG